MQTICKQAVKTKEFYKNHQHFYHKEGVCYAPKMLGDVFTYHDFLRLCQGNESLAKYVFEHIAGQHPASLIYGELADQGVLPCESCDYLYCIESHDYCPRCGKKTVEDF